MTYDGKTGEKLGSSMRFPTYEPERTEGDNTYEFLGWYYGNMLAATYVDGNLTMADGFTFPTNFPAGTTTYTARWLDTSQGMIIYQSDKGTITYTEDGEQAYVCGVDCCGTDPKGFNYDGSSMAIDFKGKNITVKGQESGLLYASLSMDKLTAFREKFPAWRDADKIFIEK